MRYRNLKTRVRVITRFLTYFCVFGGPVKLTRLIAEISKAIKDATNSAASNKIIGAINGITFISRLYKNFLFLRNGSSNVIYKNTFKHILLIIQYKIKDQI